MSQKPNMFHLTTKEILQAQMSPEIILNYIVLTLSDAFGSSDFLNRPDGTVFETSTIYRSMYNTERLNLTRRHVYSRMNRLSYHQHIFTSIKKHYRLSKEPCKGANENKSSYIAVMNANDDQSKQLESPSTLSFFEHLLQDYQVEIDLKTEQQIPL